jgi:hypothetical protein
VAEAGVLWAWTQARDRAGTPGLDPLDALNEAMNDLERGRLRGREMLIP